MSALHGEEWGAQNGIWLLDDQRVEPIWLRTTLAELQSALLDIRTGGGVSQCYPMKSCRQSIFSSVLFLRIAFRKAFSHPINICASNWWINGFHENDEKKQNYLNWCTSEREIETKTNRIKWIEPFFFFLEKYTLTLASTKQPNWQQQQQPNGK